MNAIKKINTSNGILEDGIMKHSVGFGSLEISNLGIELFGATPFYAPFPLSIFSKNTRGDNVNTEYYLTTRYAKKWNAHIEELDQLNKTDPLMDRAIELAVDGIEILGYGPPELDQIEDGYEYDYISDPTDDLDSFTTASTITSSVFHDDTDIYFKRKIKSSPDLIHLNKGQKTRLEHDSWVEQLTGNKPIDPKGANYGVMCQMAKALYGNTAN